MEYVSLGDFSAPKGGDDAPNDTTTHAEMTDIHDNKTLNPILWKPKRFSGIKSNGCQVELECHLLHCHTKILLLNEIKAQRKMIRRRGHSNKER